MMYNFEDFEEHKTTAISGHFEETINASLCRGISRLHADGEMFDVAVMIGDETFSCHSLVLAAVSKYFETLFRKYPRKEHVTISDERVTSHAFSLVLDIMYKKMDPVEDTETAMELLKAAIYLEIDFLRDHCEQFLRERLTLDVCLDVWQFADLYTLAQLASEARQFAAQEFDEVTDTPSFLSLPLPFLLSLLSSDDLWFSSDDILCAKVLSWVNESADNRAKHLPILLPFVNFSNLSEEYLQELRLEQIRFKALEGYIDEAMTVQLESLKRLNSLAKSRIVARQWQVNANAMLVIVGGVSETGTPLQDTSAFSLPEAENGLEDVSESSTEAALLPEPGRCLAPLPECHGVDFATCVWRNEIYVSGGSEHPRQFVVYNAGVDEWTVLPVLPRDLAKHAMAALNWNIFLIGGKEQDAEDNPKPSHLVQTYNLQTKTWSVFGELPVAVSNVTAAVLGHRIYVFGGKDADDNSSSLIQCMDTLTGSVYQAGHLPSPTSGARAVSDASAIFIVIAEGDILKMREREAQQTPPVPEGATSPAVESAYVSDASLAESAESSTKNAVAQNEVGAGDASHTEEADTRATLAIQTFATIEGRQHFAASIYQGNLVVCGGQDDKGGRLHDVITVDTQTGEVSGRKDVRMAEKAMVNFSMHSLLVLNLTDEGTFRHTFQPEAMVKDKRINSHRARINNFDWYISAKRVTDDKNVDSLSVFLHKTKQGPRNWKVSTEFTFWVVPNKAGKQGYSQETSYVFKDSKGVGHGT